MENYFYKLGMMSFSKNLRVNLQNFINEKNLKNIKINIGEFIK